MRCVNRVLTRGTAWQPYIASFGHQAWFRVRIPGSELHEGGIINLRHRSTPLSTAPLRLQ